MKLKAIVFFVCSIINAVRSYSNNFSCISVTIRSIFTWVIQIVGGKGKDKRSVIFVPSAEQKTEARN